ncbi:MAG TPA: hypothetical protein VGG99_02020 [Acetobacteraceae bacterium]|jgi:hypothetical protein
MGPGKLRPIKQASGQPRLHPVVLGLSLLTIAGAVADVQDVNPFRW